MSRTPEEIARAVAKDVLGFGWTSMTEPLPAVTAHAESAILAVLREAREGAAQTVEALRGGGTIEHVERRRCADAIRALAPAPSTTRAPGVRGLALDVSPEWVARPVPTKFPDYDGTDTPDTDPPASPVLPEERGTGHGICTGPCCASPELLAFKYGIPAPAAPETPATGPCDVCGGAFHEGERGWPVWQFGAAWTRKVHKRCEAAPSPGATRGDDGASNG